MSSENSEFNQNKNGKVSIKKSTFNGLIIGLIVVVGVAAFFAGNDQIGYVKMEGAQPFESFKKVIDSQLGL